MSLPKLTDLSFLDSFTKGDKLKMSRYIQMYLQNTSAVIDEMLTDFQNHNLESVRLKAHSIKPQAQYMGVVQLKECLLKIENIVKSGDGLENLDAMLLQAKETNEQAMTELRNFLNTD